MKSTLRALFEAEVNNFLATLAEQLQSNAGSYFIPLNTTQSGATSSNPFHIQLLSSTALLGLTCHQTADILKDLGSKFGQIQGQILPICTVAKTSGHVSLRICSDDYTALIEHLAGTLVGKGSTVDWSVERENLFVTIGTFQVSVGYCPRSYKTLP